MTVVFARFLTTWKTIVTLTRTKNERKEIFAYWKMKNERGRELNTSCCKRNEENAAWFRLGIWKMRVLRKGTEKGRCPLCGEGENG
jgi:hypothetical protein